MTDYESIFLGVINIIIGLMIIISKWGEWIPCIVGLLFLIFGGFMFWVGIKE